MRCYNRGALTEADPNGWQRLEEMFAEAVALPEHSCEAWLDGQARADPETGQLQALLEYDRIRAGGFAAIARLETRGRSPGGVPQPGGIVRGVELPLFPRPDGAHLGHYDPSHNAIVLSRILDRADVPRIAAEYVMFHEMLHLCYPVQHKGTGAVCIPGDLRKQRSSLRDWRRPRRR